MILDSPRSAQPVKYQFGEFELLPNQGSLWRAGVRVPVMPKSMAVLKVLVERSGQTVAKDELLARVWNGAAVEDNNITQTISTLRKVLGEKPGENRFIVTEPGNGYRFVAAVTTVEEIPATPPESPIFETIPPVTPAKPRPPVRLWLVAAAAALGLSLGAWYLLPRHPKALVRTSIAVLGFRDLSGGTETSWIDPAVSELMDIELTSGQELRTLPAENVARMRRELALTPQSTYPAQILERIWANLGADYAVAGAYRTQGEQVHLDVVLFDLRSGRQIAARGNDASLDKLPVLAQDSARRIRAQLGVRLSTVRADAEYPPAEPAAMESYARGMERLRQSDALGARPYLERAATLAPGNPLVHSGLAAAWSMLGLDNRALKEARQAWDSSSSLSRVAQLEIEGRYRELDRDLPRAIQVYQALFTLLPDDLEYGLQLAGVETRGGKAKDALNVVSALRKLPAPIGDDPRIDMADAQSAGAVSDFAHTRSSAHAAAEKARKRGARLQYARARLLESGAMQNLDIAGYADVRAEARDICAELGDRACVAAALRMEANFWAGTGSPAKARPLYAAALEISNQIGNQLEKLNTLEGLAYIEQTQGNLPAAEKDYRALLQVASEIGKQKRYPICLDLAEVLMAQGRVADAQALVQEALDDSREAAEQIGIGTSQADHAHALALKGKFPEAIAAYQDAIRVLRDVQQPDPLMLTLLLLGDTQLADGDTSGARKSYEEAGSLNRQHRGLLQPEIDMAFARLAIAARQPDDAATHARAALPVLAAAGREGDRLEDAALLARALVMRGDIAGASAVLDGIPSPEGKGFPIEALVQFRLAKSIVAANAGRRAEAGRAIDSIAAEVSRLGLPPLEKEARLAREAVMKTPDSPLPRD